VLAGAMAASLILNVMFYNNPRQEFIAPARARL
jgi:hypothetical protein